MLFPATCAVIWLLLPLWDAPGLLVVGARASSGWRSCCELAELDVAFNLAKLFAFVVLGFWFLSYFETVVVGGARRRDRPVGGRDLGLARPDEYVVSEQPGVFENLSIAFRVPGEGGAANLGPPDIVFFALFLGAAARFGLRVGLDVGRDHAAPRRDARPDRDDGRRAASRAPRRLRSASSSPNADLLWREIRAPRGEATPRMRVQ